MNQAFKKTTVASLIIYAVISLAILLGGDRDAMAMIGLTGLILGCLFFFFGLILCIPKNRRDIGKGLLLSSGIIFLIGISVCSLFQSHVNFH
jgi:hypothetical protein